MYPTQKLASQSLFPGLKTRMKDQFRSRRVALWLNLIPDLVRSGQMETSDDTTLAEEDYLTYSETLPLIPSIKDISLSKSKLQVEGNIIIHIFDNILLQIQFYDKNFIAFLFASKRLYFICISSPVTY